MARKPVQGVSDLPGQLTLLGTETNQRAFVVRLAAKPLAPSVKQRPCDHGLFSDEADQLELCEMFMS